MSIPNPYQQSLASFRANHRAWWSLLIFLLLFTISLFSELIANDKPLLVRYDSQLYFPFLKSYPETVFGGDFDTEADYHDPYLQELITTKGTMIWPLIPYSFDTHAQQPLARNR